MGTRIIIDTNVFIAALGWNGTPRKAVEAAIKQGCELIIPLEQYAELQRVLDYPAFSFTQKHKQAVEEIIALLDSIVKAKRKTNRGIVDDILLDAAEQFAVDYVITGDAALLAEKYAGKAFIRTPKQFLKK